MGSYVSVPDKQDAQASKGPSTANNGHIPAASPDAHSAILPKSTAVRKNSTTTKFSNAATSRKRTLEPLFHNPEPVLQLPVERYVRNGKVGVIVSACFGGGHTAYRGFDTHHSKIVYDVSEDERNHETPEKRQDGEILLFDKDVIEALLKQDFEGGGILAMKKMGRTWMPRWEKGTRNVVWVDIGEEFEIEEYDGLERVRLKKHVSWWKA
ncbi:hypothetical protein EJ08DRAFT_106856 [Tothia fuscella]|uniref:Uncharacterized protein n=1 Tax=Tothia fuscella TaxID=1048955 RepID=A0A9P4TRY8_9PEZI|nr:hypothetical protein EJ08DRAFT_106856 [Tothia fuscella]